MVCYHNWMCLFFSEIYFNTNLVIKKIVTVQPFISYIHKPASELSVAALQLMFTHFRNERLFYHKKVLNNTMNKLIVLPIIFLWLNCYKKFKKNQISSCIFQTMCYNSSCLWRGCSSMVEHQPSKLDTWVRFPSPAFFMPLNG